MRTISRMLVMASAMAFGLATLTAAQMMGGNQGQRMMKSADTTSQSSTESQADSLAARMSNRWNMMSQDYNRLDKEYQNMMKMDDMSKLKTEMEKYHQNMMLMRNDMMQEHDVCQMMTSMMQSGGMNGMNGRNGMRGMHGSNNMNGMHGMMGTVSPSTSSSNSKSDNH